MRILVLMGGSSPERNVSLASGEAVAKGLDAKGHQVLKMDPSNPEKVYTMIETVFKGKVGTTPKGEDQLLTLEQIAIILDNIKKFSIDLIFPALHGGWGEDGKLQALFEMTGIPFVGSGSLASALAMNKHLSKRAVESVGVPTPEYMYIPLEESGQTVKLCKKFGYPLVVKPNSKGSSVAVSIVKTAKMIDRALEAVEALKDDILIERYIPGRELTVGMLDGNGLEVLEIKPKDGFYDYLHKYTSGQTEYICPAEITLKQKETVLKYAVHAFGVMGCKIFGRVDFRMDDSGNIFFLEVNTIPGMTSGHGLLPKTAESAGMSFPELVNRIAVNSMNLRR